MAPKKSKGVKGTAAQAKTAQQTSINSLPADVLLHVLRHLPGEDRSPRLGAVCRRWHQIISSPSALWADTHVKASPKGTQYTLHVNSTLPQWLMGMMPSLRSITFCANNDPAARSYASDTMVTDTALASILGMLSAAPHLTALTFQGWHMGAAVLHALQFHSQLRKLSIDAISGTPTCHQFECAFRNLPALEECFITLGGIDTGRVQDPVASIPDSLCSCTRLRRLSLNMAHRMAFNIMPAKISQLTALQRLELKNCQVASLPTQASRLTKLEILRIGNGVDTSATLLPDELIWLSASLRELDITVRQVPPAVQHLTNLTTLTLDRLVWSYARPQIAALSTLKKLRHFRICNTQGSHLACNELDVLLSRLPELSCLRLDGNDLVSMDLNNNWLSRLTKIDLSGNRLEQQPSSLAAARSCRHLLISFGSTTPLFKAPDGREPVVLSMKALKTLTVQRRTFSAEDCQVLIELSSQYRRRHKRELRIVTQVMPTPSAPPLYADYPSDSELEDGYSDDDYAQGAHYYDEDEGYVDDYAEEDYEDDDWDVDADMY